MRTEQEKVIRAEMTMKWVIPKVFKACFIGSDHPLLILLCKALDACPRLCSFSLLLMDQLCFFELCSPHCVGALLFPGNIPLCGNHLHACLMQTNPGTPLEHMVRIH